MLYDDANLIISGIPETVDVMIQGSSADVTQATLFKDFTIFADLKSLEVGQHQVAIQHENLSPNLTVTIEPALVEVTIDEKVTKEVTVEPEINTRLIGENYSLKNISVEPDKVTVTGAKKIIESISYIKATASPEELVATNFTQNVNVKVLDRDLNRLNVITSPEEVAVTVEVEPYSKQVPLTLLEKGKLADGLVIDEIADEMTANDLVISDSSDNGWIVRINDTVNMTKKIASIYWHFLSEVAEIRGKKPEKDGKIFIEAENEKLYQNLNEPFRMWLTGIKPKDSKDNKVSEWYETLKNIALSQAESLVDNASTRDFTGIIKEDHIFNIFGAYKKFRNIVLKLNENTSVVEMNTLNNGGPGNPHASSALYSDTAYKPNQTTSYDNTYNSDYANMQGASHGSNAGYYNNRFN